MNALPAGVERPTAGDTRPAGRKIAAVLLAATVLSFVPGLLGEFIWDDRYLIAGNANVRDLSRLGNAFTEGFWDTTSTGEEGRRFQSYYRPVVTTAYAVQFRVFGDEPFGYHVVSLLLHAACVLLAFGWLRRRLGDAGGAGVVAAALGAALFALHPSRPETVSWIAGSTDLWMTMWILAGLHAWDRLQGARGLALSTLAFGLAVLCKETAVVVPPLLLAEALLLRRPDVAGISRVRAGLVACAATAGIVLLRLLVVPLPGGGGAGDEGLAGALARTASSLGHYVALAAWPWPPSVLVGCRTLDESGLPGYATWSVALGVVAAAGVAALVWRALRNAAARPWLADACWFLVPLLPVLNIVPMQSSTLVAARFLYLPLLGAAALLTRAVLPAVRRGGRARLAAVAAGAAAAAACGAISLYHERHLRSEDDMWSYEHDADPASFCAINGLARLRMEQGRFVEALDLARTAWDATRSRPWVDYPALTLAARSALLATPDAAQERLLRIRRFYDDLAGAPAAQLDAGGVRASIPVSEALRARLLGDVEGFRVPRAVARARTLDLAGAERQLREIVAETPGSAGAWRQLVLVLARLEAWIPALEAAEEGMRRNPGFRPLAELLVEVERQRRILDGTPDSDPVERALARAGAFLAFDAPELARRTLDPLIRAHPDRPQLVITRAVADAYDGEFDAARARILAARERDPERSPLWTETLGELDAARTLYGGRRQPAAAP